MSAQKQCVTCSKSGGILTCNGCERTFCGKHVIEHRQELATQLDRIMQEHDLIQQELEQSSVNNSLMKQINQWEKESITKIQVAAEAARADLRQFLDRSKERIAKACHDIAVNLRSSREADDFSENDLTRWMQQLEELKLEATSPSLIQLVEDERSVIHFFTIREKNNTKMRLASGENESFLKHSSKSISQERFSKVIGHMTIDEDGLLAQCNNSSASMFTYALGQQRYSQDRQTVRFKIEQSETPYNMFFGCISSQGIENKIHLQSPFVVGWFGYNQVYQHNSCNSSPDVHGYNSDQIVTNDVLHLTFDCGKRQLELFHERINKRHILPVNVDKAPLPWQLLVIMDKKNDCIRILL